MTNENYNMIEEIVTEEMAVLPLRGVSIFPHTVMHLDAQRKISVAAIEYAMQHNKPVLLLAQVDPSVEYPKEGDFYRIGTIAKVKQLLKLPNHCVRVLVDARIRGESFAIYEKEGMLFSQVKRCARRQITRRSKQMEAQIRSLKDVYAEYFKLVGRISPDVMGGIVSTNDLEKLTDIICGSLFIDYEEKQFLLEMLDPKKRVTELIKILTAEIDLLQLEIDIQAKVKSQIDKNQKEYYLREQIRAIHEELGEEEDVHSESEEYLAKLEDIKTALSEDSYEKVKKQITRFAKMHPQAQETMVERNYLDTLFDLPWLKATKENIDLKKCMQKLDRDHYGLDKVKEKLLEYLSAKKFNPAIKSQILCLVGPPGVGKTSIVKSIADSIGRKYQRMSLGGVHDEAEIRGHRRTYVGAMPGKIMAAIRTAGVKNPLILLDEIDKLGKDMRGDPASALLEALDKEQNNTFTDHYVDLPFDLSEVLFITTANSLDTIPGPLLDRMEVIELSGYTRYEKYRIATDYLVKKQYKEHNLTKKTLKIDDGAIYSMIDYYVREAGVRRLERTLITLIRKAEKQMLLSDKKSITVTADNLETFLGKKKYIVDPKNPFPEVGAALGLAWTAAGGDTLFCEAVAVDGTGKIEATGSLGDVMKESAKIAVAYIRSVADRLQLDKDFYKTKDIYIHFPDGATPKDGPSAGITIALAVTSALTGRKIRNDVAMTGEISIRGKVLPIGGLKEKSISAHRAGVFNIIIPKENEKDLEEIPKEIFSDFNFMSVSEFWEVLEIALLPKDDDESVDFSHDAFSQYNVYENKI